MQGEFFHANFIYKRDYRFSAAAPCFFVLFAIESETNLTSFHPAAAVHSLPDTASMHSGRVHPEPDLHYRSLHSRMPVHPVLPYQRLPCSGEQRLR